MRSVSICLTSILCVVALRGLTVSAAVAEEKRPNILIAISDDQSFPYASAYGCRGVSTPAFDRVARGGVLFTNAFAASPGCSPSRAALLTGRHPWQIEHAGTHASWFPTKYVTFPEILQQHGYFVGYTGKGWGPGRHFGREHNPAGPQYAAKTADPPYTGISSDDYASNFAAFLRDRPDDRPFCFWYGAHEPHRKFEKGSWKKAGKKLEDAVVPPFLPDTPEIRADVLDYCVEIEWFDHHLARILALLEEAGELDDTLMIVTSDNGMAFPRAKANCYEYGIHVPLAIRWGDHVSGGRTIGGPVGFVDLTATILDAARAQNPSVQFPPSGRSLVGMLESDGSGHSETSGPAVFSARERHSSSRFHNLAYPQRAMRTRDFLSIRNFRPGRWPAGAPQKFDQPPTSDRPGVLGPMHGGYHDIDACPTLTFLIEHREQDTIRPYFRRAVDHRPAVEIFDIRHDPGCLRNLAGQQAFAETERQLARQFEALLRETGDPRLLNGGDIFETYRRYSRIRTFPPPPAVADRDRQLGEQGWQNLFNGRDLAGWKAGGAAGSFEVINGMVKAEATTGSAHLFYVGDGANADFKDFELTVDSLATPKSIGGVYFHTRFQQSGFPNDGHEVQVNNTHRNPVRTGSLFDVVDVNNSPVSDDVFFTQHITVRGKHVTVSIDGRTIVDYTEPAGYQHPTYAGRNIGQGTIALQAHDPDSIVYYRNIWIRPLKK